MADVLRLTPAQRRVIDYIARCGRATYGSIAEARVAGVAPQATMRVLRRHALIAYEGRAYHLTDLGWRAWDANGRRADA